MWKFFVRAILRNRILNLAVIITLTAIMGYFASKVELSYEYAQMLPENDPVNNTFKQFKETFKEDGSIFFAGIQTDKINNLDFFSSWQSLTNELLEIHGVREVFSITNIFQLSKDEEEKKFKIEPLISDSIDSQSKLDSLLNVAYSLKFYEQFIFSQEHDIHLMLIWIEKSVLNSKKRIDVIHNIKNCFEEFSQNHNVDIHYSGLPYIRTVISKKIQDELIFLVVISIIVCMLILLFFFRSFRAVVLPVLIVIIGAIWTLGTMSLFGYRISVLTGVLPPILIIIGIENCIYLLTRYHKEIREHGGIGRALTRVIQKTGYATLLTNATTAVGFGAFIVTGNAILVEFGIIASINILLMFVFSIILIPVLYSFFELPKKRHTKHLDKTWINFIYKGIIKLVLTKRKLVFTTSIFLAIFGIAGLCLLETKGTMVDDIPNDDPLYKDLMFFEQHLGGVLPYEISVNTGTRNGLLNINNIRKINELQELLMSHPEIARPLSYVEILKFSKQAFYNGNPNMYDIPNEHEKSFIFSYIPNFDSAHTPSLLNAFVDSNMQTARISARLKNLNTNEIAELNNKINKEISEIFTDEKYEINITGTSVVFLKGSGYLIKNLLLSLAVAMILISLLMYLLFNSFKMVLVSMVPNILPQLLTAAIMGYAGIDIKPSTIIIYSIALGISVDAAIHLLSRYRQQLIATNWNVTTSIQNALKETSVGMVYSGIVLILGFSVFTLSTFGGTQSLGYLVAFTLGVAMFSNLILLPSIILGFKKFSTTKAFSRPLLRFLKEENGDEKFEV